MLRVRINSRHRRADPRVWRGGGRRPAHGVHRTRGATRTLDATHGGASGSWARSHLGEWVTLAFTYNVATGRRVRSARRAGGDVHGRADDGRHHVQRHRLARSRVLDVNT
jgi:hypothetical protein